MLPYQNRKGTSWYISNHRNMPLRRPDETVGGQRVWVLRYRYTLTQNATIINLKMAGKISQTLSSPQLCMDAYIFFWYVIWTKKLLNSPIGTFSGPSVCQHAVQSCLTCVFNNRVGVWWGREYGLLIFIHYSSTQINAWECDVVMWLFKLVPHKMSIYTSLLQASQNTTKPWPSLFSVFLNSLH